MQLPWRRKNKEQAEPGNFESAVQEDEKQQGGDSEGSDQDQEKQGGPPQA